ncbi:MAG: prepilin-type N-terminal cleavage/methylation domain-containing protein [Phycisphaerales bacterium]
MSCIHADAPFAARSAPTLRRGFTIIEILVVVFVLAVLLGLLFPALSGALAAGRETKSVTRLRQIATYMADYSARNKDYVLPTYFDNSGASFQGGVRNGGGGGVGEGMAFTGTWADIIWAENELLQVPVVDAGGSDIVASNGRSASAYLTDSPDKFFHEGVAEVIGFSPFDDNPLRSAEPNTRNAQTPNPDGWAYQFAKNAAGGGATEIDLPGYFAGNAFFDAARDPDPRTKFGYWTNPQIREPSNSMYLIDSAWGELIPDEPEAFELVDGEPQADTHVDFRYGGSAAVLFMDGSFATVSDWQTLDRLESGNGAGRRVRVRKLADRTAQLPAAPGGGGFGSGPGPGP